MRLGVLGGTFDPVHVGHLILGEAAREELALDRVLFVPAGQPWRKAERQITAAQHRERMVRLAAEDNPAFEVCTIEVNAVGPSYTVETLEHIRAENGDSELFFIVGLDAFQDMPNWKDPEKIAELAVIAVTGRPGYGGGVESSPAVTRPNTGEGVTWFPMPEIGFSSTTVREMVGRGKSIRYLVTPPVETYIRDKRLYLG